MKDKIIIKEKEILFQIFLQQLIYDSSGQMHLKKYHRALQIELIL